TLAEGDRVGLVGPNGSGKTTLLRLLAGVETPDTGTRSLRRQARLGYVPQEPGFPAGGSGGPVGAGAGGRARAVSRAPRAPVRVAPGARRTRVARAGERPRRPDVLLLDEPTNHLDVEG